MLLVDDIYQFNLINTNKDNSKLFKFKEHKTDLKSQAYIKMKNDQILDY